MAAWSIRLAPVPLGDEVLLAGADTGGDMRLWNPATG
jgi:hypothetical protein